MTQDLLQRALMDNKQIALCRDLTVKIFALFCMAELNLKLGGEIAIVMTYLSFFIQDFQSTIEMHNIYPHQKEKTKELLESHQLSCLVSNPGREMD